MNLFNRNLTNLKTDLPYHALQVVLFILNTTLIAPQFYCFLFCLVIYSQSTLRVQYTMHWHDRSCLCIHIPQFFCCLFQIMLVPHPKPQPMYSLNNYYHMTVYSNLTKCFALFPLMPLLPTVVLSLREDSLSEVLIFCLEECDPRSTNG